MLRVAISVEGATEREFVSHVLSDYFTSFGLYLTAVDIKGNVSIDRVIPEIQKLLYSYDRVTTLYDFYGFKKSQGRSIDALEQELLDRIAPEKQQFFLPYIQQYEFESLLFSDPSILTNELLQPAKISMIANMVHNCNGAENINNSRETSPSHRLKKIFPDYEKKFHGPVICKKIGLTIIREKCPRFNRWIGNLEKFRNS